MLKQVKKHFSKLKNLKINISKKSLQTKIMPSVLVVILILSLIATYQVVMDDKFFPLTFVGDTNVSFLTRDQALQALQAKTDQRAKSQLSFAHNNKNYPVDLATSSASLNLAESLNQAFKIGHTGPFSTLLLQQIRNIFSPTVITTESKISLNEQLSTIQQQVLIEPINAKLVIDEGNTATSSADISIVEGKNGQKLDETALVNEITQYLNFGEYSSSLPVKVEEPKITTSEALTAKQFLESNSAEPITLISTQDKWVIDTKTLLSFINLEKDKILDQDKMTNYLTEMVAGKIDQEVQEGLFTIDPTSKRVSEFKASQEGRKLNIDQTIALITKSLENSGPKLLTLPVEVVKPKIQTGDVNNLGINDLIASGKSSFSGSIPNRIYNVNLGAAKINGVLIPPGEVFSFNKTVGDISAATGFKQAYVIKSGRTVLDDGGGICQVSTTLFRAVLNAGLPIVDRTAHAYRVGYYEQGFAPGLDATIFYPSVDFKFKNDTPNHILIQTRVEGVNLTVDFYGTSDGRVSNITKPIIHSQSPPLPELRQDDPELPVGTVKQVDFPAWGANVSFKRTVLRNGQTLIDETVRSNYRPWQAVYLVGTKPI